MSPSGRVNNTGSPSPNAADDTMKCALAVGFTGDEHGQVQEIIEFTTSAPKPVLNPKKKQMLIRVLACSLSAGDTLVLTGKMIMLKPKLPYVPGMDVCGVVEAVTGKVKGFKTGDIVVANNGFLPIGGMAEYMVVDPVNAALNPASVDVVQAASCSSAITSLQAVDYINAGDRVLILGGSGGVGSAAITLAKNADASFVATTSTQKDMCIALGADKVIDYREQNWWEIDEFRKGEKFDKVIDCVGGGNFYGKATHVLKVGKEGGKFIAVTGDNPRPDLSSWFKVLKYFATIPCRPLFTSVRKRKYPIFVYILPNATAATMDKVLKLMDEDKLKVQLDPSSPHDFTEEGIRSAFEIQGSGHAHGKVCVRVSDAHR